MPAAPTQASSGTQRVRSAAARRAIAGCKGDEERRAEDEEGHDDGEGLARQRDEDGGADEGAADARHGQAGQDGPRRAEFAAVAPRAGEGPWHEADRVGDVRAHRGHAEHDHDGVGDERVRPDDRVDRPGPEASGDDGEGTKKRALRNQGCRWGLKPPASSRLREM